MNNEEFQKLLDERDHWERRHQAFCEGYNECNSWTEQAGHEAARLYGRVLELQAQVDAVLEAERAEDECRHTLGYCEMCLPWDEATQ